MGIISISQLRQRANQGQMTVEMAVCIPAMIALALVVFNAMLFFENCAAFDRLARDAVRVYAAVPAHGQSSASGAALVEASLNQAFPESYLRVSVQTQGSSLGFTTYIAKLQFRPSLFGRSFSGNVFGTSLGTVEHNVSFTVDPYKPGVLL